MTNYIDVNAPRAQGRYNTYLVSLVGLEAAVYYQLIYEISDLANSKAGRKDTLNEEGFFGVDRKFIRERTAISTEQQRIYDQAFSALGIVTIYPTNPDWIYVDNEKMIAYITGTDAKTEKKAFFSDATKTAKAGIQTAKRSAKRDVIMAKWNSWVTGSDAVRSAYNRLFTSWYDKGIQTDEEVSAKIKILEECTDDNFKLAAIEYAIQTGYKNMAIVVNNTRVTYNPMRDQKISNGTVSAIKF